MKKGIAVPYIIAIILGIAVIGIIGASFVTTTGILGGSSSSSDCNSKRVQWCNEWSKIGFLGNGPIIFGTWDSFAPGCDELNIREPGQSFCRGITGTLLGPGAICSENGECRSQSCETDCIPNCARGYTAGTVTCGEARCTIACTKAGSPNADESCNTPKKCK